VKSDGDEVHDDPSRDEGSRPVITLVRFRVGTAPLSAEEQRTLFERTAPRYRSIPGLRRKWFLSAPGLGGGLYEWRSRAAALAWFDGAWFERMRSTYGADPELEWFDAPCVVDNERGAIEMRIAPG
jgi:hypothetical protein